ncbi:MAG: mechanosensitive ion channel domain-containing protein [Pseudomonadota bacterium]
MDINEAVKYLRELYAIPIMHRLAVILIYILLAKFADIVVIRFLVKITAKTKFTLDDKIIPILHAPLLITVVFVGVLHALAMPPDLSAPWEKVLPATAKTIILLFWIIGILKFFSLVVESNMHTAISRGKIGQDLFMLLKNVVRVIILILSLLWLLSIWHVNMAPLFASAGIAGIAVALAAKETLSNFFGGISIFADKTCTVGDYIILDNSERGEVMEIGIRSTRIKTRDDVLITIPNSILANSKIINESAPIPRFRIRVPVGVAYGSVLDQVEEIMLTVAAANKMVIREPEARVRLRSFGASSLDFELLCWVEDPSLKGLTTHNLLKEIYNAFTEHNITIPFPQQDVYIKEFADRNNGATREELC